MSPTAHWRLSDVNPRFRHVQPCMESWLGADVLVSLSARNREQPQRDEARNASLPVPVGRSEIVNCANAV